MSVNWTYLYTFLILALLVISCEPAEVPELEVSVQEIERHLSQLASDEFLGRKPFTEGEVKTIAYLENAFREMGLAPGNEDSYLQEVPLVEIAGEPDALMTIGGKGEALNLRLKEDFVTYTEREQTEIKVKDSEMVFCGYGIVAPEYNWNDYEGIDMKGKTAVVLVNDPGFGNEDSTFFKGI